MIGVRRSVAGLARGRDLPRYLWERSGAASLLVGRPGENGRAPAGPAKLDGLLRPAEIAGLTRRTQAPELSICIPSRDRLDLLIPCLASLAQTAAGGPVEVVIGDTGSSAQTLEVYERLSLSYISLPGPFNFSRACNAMAGAAAGGRLLFLNNDTRALGPGWLERLLAQPADRIVGASLVYPATCRIQSAGIGVA